MYVACEAGKRFRDVSHVPQTDSVQVAEAGGFVQLGGKDLRKVPTGGECHSIVFFGEKMDLQGQFGAEAYSKDTGVSCADTLT